MKLESLLAEYPTLAEVLSNYFESEPDQLLITPQLGLSLNKSYKLSLNSKEVLLKILSDKREIKDQKNEIFAMQATSHINISPEVIYAATLSNSSIVLTRYIKHQTLKPEFLKRKTTLTKVATLLLKLHRSNLIFTLSGTPFDIASYYLDSAIKNGFDNPLIINMLRENLSLLQSFPINPSLRHSACHFDLNIRNILFDENNLSYYLIDWENAINSDPFFDLASFCFFNNLSSEEILFFLQSYFKHSNIGNEIACVYFYKQLCLLMISSWFCLKLVLQGITPQATSSDSFKLSELIENYISGQFQSEDTTYSETNLLHSAINEFLFNTHSFAWQKYYKELTEDDKRT